jgi:hypothetical protein
MASDSTTVIGMVRPTASARAAQSSTGRTAADDGNGAKHVGMAFHDAPG